MRTVLAVLIAAVAAVAFALWFQTLDGYVVAVFPPYRFQLSSQLLVLLALLFLFVGYGVLRLVARIIGTPASVRHWRERPQFWVVVSCEIGLSGSCWRIQRLKRKAGVLLPK